MWKSAIQLQLVRWFINYHVHCTSSKNDEEMCCPEVCCFRFFAMKATSTTPNLLGLHVPLSQLELPSHQVDDRVSLASSRHFKRPRKRDIIKIRKERKSPTSVVVMNNPHLKPFRKVKKGGDTTCSETRFSNPV